MVQRIEPSQQISNQRVFHLSKDSFCQIDPHETFPLGTPFRATGKHARFAGHGSI